MDKFEVAEHLAEVKVKLADKYDALARLTRSAPRQRKLHNRADVFRQQALDLARKKPR